jgi:hypothetical protein
MGRFGSKLTIYGAIIRVIGGAMEEIKPAGSLGATSLRSGMASFADRRRACRVEVEDNNNAMRFSINCPPFHLNMFIFFSDKNVSARH